MNTTFVIFSRDKELYITTAEMESDFVLKLPSHLSKYCRREVVSDHLSISQEAIIIY